MVAVAIIIRVTACHHPALGIESHTTIHILSAVFGFHSVETWRFGFEFFRHSGFHFQSSLALFRRLPFLEGEL